MAAWHDRGHGSLRSARPRPLSRLLLLNGPPGVGKSTLARRYAADRPLCLVLDLDRLRADLGCWRDDPDAAGVAARELGVSMIEAHLVAGHDVVVPQLLARRSYAQRLAGLGAVEVLLWCSRPDALRRFAERAADPEAPQEPAGVVGDYHDRLAALDLPRVEVVEGDVEATYARLLEVLC